MPSRKWHEKSTVGCLICKDRRIKVRCSGMINLRSLSARSSGTSAGPNAVNLRSLSARSSGTSAGPNAVNVWEVTKSGAYATLKTGGVHRHGLKDSEGDADRTVTVWTDTDAPEFQKRWHKKSRTGNLGCRHRRPEVPEQCDERTPACQKCRRAGAVCIYPESSDLQSTTPIPVQLHLARVTNAFEYEALEYFHHYTRPVFQAWQASTLWDHTLGFSMQTYPAMRSIAAALGCRQRITDGVRAIDSVPHAEAWRQAEVLYGNGIRSLRHMLTTMPATDAPVAILCCVY